MTKSRGAKSQGPALVEADGVGIGYGHPVCPRITFAMGSGDVVAVVGANGAGKSTLLRTAVGLLPPLGGRLAVLGAEPDGRSARFRAAVAVDLGGDAFFPALTVREHLMLTCYGHGVQNPARVVADLVEAFGLGEIGHTLPTALSSGQRRRVLLAAAFVRPRSLMILDEPEQRLDAGMRRLLAERLVEEREGGGAVLLATHDPEVVRAAATRAVVLTASSAQVVPPEQAAAAIDRL